MQTPDEFARERLCHQPHPDDTDGGICDTHCQAWPCDHEEVHTYADLIHARDAEVRADERAKVLEGMGGECEQCVYGSGYVMDGGACPCWINLTECRPGCTCAGDAP